MAALTSVQDPSQGQDIVVLGILSGLQIKDSNISLALAAPAYRGSAMGPVRLAAATAALAIDGETRATVVVTAQSESNPSKRQNQLK